MAFNHRDQPHPTPIVFAFDKGYGKYTCVSIASLLCHSKVCLDIHCLTADIDDPHIGDIQATAERFGSSLTLHHIDPSKFAEWKTEYHFSAANYYRVSIPSLIKNSRALYLDSDLVVTCNVQELLDLDMDGSWMAGVPDFAGAAMTRMPRPEGEPYINSGVLLLDLDRLRDSHFEDRFKQIYEEHEQQITWADQCVINEFALGKKLVLDERWNVQSTNHQALSLRSKIGHFDGCGIIHGSGRRKPWMRWADPWLSGLWSSYARLTGIPAEDLMIEPQSDIDFHMLAKMYDAEKRWEEASAVKGELLRKLLTT